MFRAVSKPDLNSRQLSGFLSIVSLQRNFAQVADDSVDASKKIIKTISMFLARQHLPYFFLEIAEKFGRS